MGEGLVGISLRFGIGFFYSSGSFHIALLSIQFDYCVQINIIIYSHFILRLDTILLRLSISVGYLPLLISQLVHFAFMFQM